MDKQNKLDLLYAIGCQFPISRKDLEELCKLAEVDYEELLNHTGPSVPTH